MVRGRMRVGLAAAAVVVALGVPAAAAPVPAAEAAATVRAAERAPLASASAPAGRPAALPRAGSRTKVIYLTFDDGPRPPTTPRLLTALRKHGAKATFFMVGHRAAKYPRLVQRVAADGHAIGNHTYWHEPLTRVSPARMRTELARANRVLRGVVGPCMRPPYGDTNRAVRAEARRQGMTQVLWSYDTFDWRRPGVDVLVKRFTRGTYPGAVILAHDIHPGTITAVERMLPRWKRMGYELRTLPACRR